ncbi:MAG: LacI family transcriptional regulator [Treponema sp.]|nr:LacI family transcriptional regulator [Treponema sp.]
MNTIFDVAKMAKVSKSTVSRVLNQNDAVKPEIKEKVLKAIKKLDYTPSYFAQGIRTGRTKTVAMLVPDFSNVFYSELFRGVESVALKSGYMVIICNTDRRIEEEFRYINKLVGRKIDGIIYNTYNISRDNINTLMAITARTPIVFMDNVFKKKDNLSYVITEGYDSTCEAVTYLFRQNRRRIGYIGMGPKISVLEHRFRGYLKGLANCGFPVEEVLIYRPDSVTFAETTHLNIGAMAGAHFASLPHPPDAIVAGFDILAIGCMRELKKLGVKIPEDMAVIGFDNISFCELVDPALSTIGQPIAKLGEAAAQIIIDKLEGKPCQERVVFPGELILRQSA